MCLLVVCAGFVKPILLLKGSIFFESSASRMITLVSVLGDGVGVRALAPVKT